MQISEKKLNKDFQKQILSVFYQVLADLKTPKEVEIFCEDFLSQVETVNLAKRLAIMLFLQKKQSYEEIKRMVRVSSATIAEVEKKLETPGINLALRKIEAEVWADQWSKKINSAFQKIFPPKKVS